MSGHHLSSAIRAERDEIIMRMRAEGWTDKEIAGYLGIPVRNVQSRVARGRPFVSTRTTLSRSQDTQNPNFVKVPPPHPHPVLDKSNRCP